MKNKTIIMVVKSMMKEMATFLTDKQKYVFCRMYHHGKYDTSVPISNDVINMVIDNMVGSELDHAFTQMENTLK